MHSVVEGCNSYKAWQVFQFQITYYNTSKSCMHMKVLSRKQLYQFCLNFERMPPNEKLSLNMVIFGDTWQEISFWIWRYFLKIANKSQNTRFNQSESIWQSDFDYILYPDIKYTRYLSWLGLDLILEKFELVELLMWLRVNAC